MPARSRSGSTRAASTSRPRRRCWPSTRTTRRWSASSVQADPGRRGRARLDLHRLAQHFRGRALLFVTHSWGGGIQRHIDDMIARLKAEGTAVVLLSVDRARNIQVNVSYRSREFVYLPSLDSLYLPRDAAV